MSDRSNKDKAMAAYLKEHGVKRTSGKCPICNSEVSIRAMYQHIAFHK